MSKKSAIMRRLNMRAAKTALYSAICRLPGLRQYLNYYQDAAGIEEMAVEGSVRALRIDPVNDYGITFSEADIAGILRCKDVSPESLMLVFKMARLADVSILGSSGGTVGNRSGKVLGPVGRAGRLHPNWVVAGPLRTVGGDPPITRVNLLWMRKVRTRFHPDEPNHMPAATSVPRSGLPVAFRAPGDANAKYSLRRSPKNMVSA